MCGAISEKESEASGDFVLGIEPLFTIK